MISFVLDASATLAWCFEDEADARSGQLLTLLLKNEAVVPVIWIYEIANSLLSGLRIKRISQADSENFIALLSSFPIEIDSAPGVEFVGNLLSLSSEQGISGYDAAYLELAARKNLPLATLDVSLRKAAKKLGVRLVV